MNIAPVSMNNVAFGNTDNTPKVSNPKTEKIKNYIIKNKKPIIAIGTAAVLAGIGIAIAAKKGMFEGIKIKHMINKDSKAVIQDSKQIQKEAEAIQAESKNVLDETNKKIEEIKALYEKLGLGDTAAEDGRVYTLTQKDDSLFTLLVEKNSEGTVLRTASYGPGLNNKTYLKIEEFIDATGKKSNMINHIVGEGTEVGLNIDRTAQDATTIGKKYVFNAEGKLTEFYQGIRLYGENNVNGHIEKSYLFNGKDNKLSKFMQDYGHDQVVKENDEKIKSVTTEKTGKEYLFNENGLFEYNSNRIRSNCNLDNESLDTELFMTFDKKGKASAYIANSHIEKDTGLESSKHFCTLEDGKIQEYSLEYKSVNGEETSKKHIKRKPVTILQYA